jgi:glycerol-3-phosphate O-acyltransferase/dihydroxyacetone phosphate acyltransferase
MHQVISSGTIDSPSWTLIRTAKLAARMYAPLGTYMSLGDHVRVIRAFLEAFKAIDPNSEIDGTGKSGSVTSVGGEIAQLRDDLKVCIVSLNRLGSALIHYMSSLRAIKIS